MIRPSLERPNTSVTNTNQPWAKADGVEPTTTQPSLPPQTKQTEELGEVSGVEQNRTSSCTKANDCWWTVTIEEPANTEWGLQTRSRPNLANGQVIRAQVESTAQEERMMTAEEVANHLPRLLSFTIVDPQNDSQVQELLSTLSEERRALADGLNSEARESAKAVPTSIVEAVSHWRTAVLDGNPEEEAACFAQQVERYYLVTNTTRDYIRAEIEKQVASAQVQNTDVQVSQMNADRISDEYAELDFIQTVRMLQKGLPRTSTVHTYMHLKREQGLWKVSFLRQFNLPA